MKLIYLLVVLVLSVTIGHGQQKRDTIHPVATHKKAKMKDALGLDKKQAKEVKASKKEFKEEKDKVNADPNLSASEKKEKIKKLKEEKTKKIDATLTPEQKEKAKALKKEKKKSS